MSYSARAVRVLVADDLFEAETESYGRHNDNYMHGPALLEAKVKISAAVGSMAGSQRLTGIEVLISDGDDQFRCLARGGRRSCEVNSGNEISHS